jgi:hypothetical protein
MPISLAVLYAISRVYISCIRREASHPVSLLLGGWPPAAPLFLPMPAAAAAGRDDDLLGRAAQMQRHAEDAATTTTGAQRTKKILENSLAKQAIRSKRFCNPP